MGKTKAKESEVIAAKIYSKEQVLKWYEEMLLIRRFEEKAGQVYGQGKIRGFCHLYIGQEAVAVGVESAIRPDDYVITAYRDHGNALARGVSARACMAELYGKVTGCTKGKGGSMHFFSKEHNFLGGHGIVGSQIGLGAGIAFACKYRKEDKICICLFGDGAARQGILHECFNLAMFWKLPVVYICENNKYAMGTSVERSSNVTDIYQLGAAYHMPSEQVNGMDVISVYERVKAAADYVRAGNGPIFLEIVTYRYKGHSMSDPGKYRTKEEVAAYQDQDPILKLKAYMFESNYGFTEEDFDAIDERVKEVVRDAVEFAEKSPYPDPSEIYTDVYVGDYPFIVD
ncbi:MAG: pyruvate dehydrogenase (acetyl-transferring) E1 component subunit alpha [Bacteroidia bacterium]|nr:pyruvate dehydrogenase (acetyl-transferring) E1 component subunit alpha [Bacteroidia bacterium]MDW8158491.1 pyruvate dehydrogenase (acetyl-transferring) E1 component subunit alpha [Bacteroidia bacterium]